MRIPNSGEDAFSERLPHVFKALLVDNRQNTEKSPLQDFSMSLYGYPARRCVWILEDDRGEEVSSYLHLLVGIRYSSFPFLISSYHNRRRRVPSPLCLRALMGGSEKAIRLALKEAGRNPIILL